MSDAGGMPGAPLPVLINADARQGAGAVRTREIAAALEKSGVAARLVCCAPNEVSDALRSAIETGATRVAVGGGDGTISVAARTLAGSSVVLGVLPLGTLNHFARDAGIPDRLDAALDVLASGRVAEVDLGKVNDRTFVNNLSLGMYPAMVRDREAQRRSYGRGKWHAAFWAALAALRWHPFLAVRVSAAGVERVVRTPQVFVGNNRYETYGPRIGERLALDRGLLSLYVVRCNGRLGLWWWVVRAMLGRLERGRDFEEIEAAELSIESRHRALDVALDGELARLEPPLVCRSLPRALRVLVPAG